MKRRFLIQDGQGALELLESAFQLLRQLSLSTWSIYLGCVLPFLTAFLYFWTDMATNALGEERLVSSAFWLTVAFLIAKVGQSFLADRLFLLSRGSAAEPWSMGRIVQICLNHLRWQPLGLLLIPVAAVLTAPAAWTIGFFQTATVLSGDPTLTTPPSARLIWKQSRRWALQNHEMLGAVTLLGLVIYLNLFLLTWAAPQLLKMLLGIDSVFSQSPWSVLNSTVLISVLGLTLLALDPLLKAAYVLRCFQGDSIQNGADLLVALRERQAQMARGTTPVLMLLFLFLSSATHLASGEASPTSPNNTAVIPRHNLDRAIDRTLAQREYVWRLPPESKPSPVSTGEGAWERFWKQVRQTITKVFDFIESGFGDVQRWIRKLLSWGPKPGDPNQKVTMDWASPLKALCYLGLVVVVGMLGYIGVRWILDRRSNTDPTGGSVQPSSAAPDLQEETIRADLLPPDGWLELAMESLARGEHRLAMRAFYLSSLAHLGAERLLQLSTGKSNQDYLTELRRRGHSLPQTVLLFSENLQLFEKVWYGSHPVTPELLKTFQSRVTELRSTSR